MSRVVTLQSLANSEEEETITFNRKNLEAERSTISTIIMQQKKALVKTIAEKGAETMKVRALETVLKEKKDEIDKHKNLNEIIKNELNAYKSKTKLTKQVCDISKDFTLDEDEIKQGSEDYYNKVLKNEVDDYIKKLRA